MRLNLHETYRNVQTTSSLILTCVCKLLQIKDRNIPYYPSSEPSLQDDSNEGVTMYVLMGKKEENYP